MRTQHHRHTNSGTRLSDLGHPVVTSEAAAHTPRSPDAPVSMAMHLHASFSENTGSYEAHLSEAHRLGVDVVWWTDHDLHLRAHRFRTEVHFDGPVEHNELPELPWTWEEERDGPLSASGGEFITSPHSPDEPGGALRLYARADHETPGTLWYHARAKMRHYSTSLADTTLELDIYPEVVGEDGEFILEIESSYHPATDERPAGKYTLHYRVGGVQGERRFVDEDRLTGIIERPAATGKWHRLRVRPVDDIAALWPDLVATDNSLYKLRLGVRSTNGFPTQVVVDRLRIHRTHRQGQRPLELRRGVLDHYAHRFAGVRRYEALEFSMIRHLNWFGDPVVMPDYSRVGPVRDDELGLVRAAIDYIHAHGGLASLNHPMNPMYPDTDNPVKLSRMLLDTNAMGADIVELGHRPQLSDLLYVLDVTARNAVFYTGTGVSDDHLGEDWINQPFNYLTHVWAASPELPDLLNALRRGRAWFADAGAWRGALDTCVFSTPAMGRVVKTHRTRAPVAITATELPSDSVLEIVTGPIDRAGRDQPEPAIESRAVPSRALRRGTHQFDVDLAPAGTYVRAQLRGSDGTIVAAGNPTWLLPAESEIDIPPARLVHTQDESTS